MMFTRTNYKSNTLKSAKEHLIWRWTILDFVSRKASAKSDFVPAILNLRLLPLPGYSNDISIKLDPSLSLITTFRPY